MKKKISDILGYFDTICPNQYSEAEKIAWLNEIDEMIFNEIIEPRANPLIDQLKKSIDVLLKKYNYDEEQMTEEDKVLYEELKRELKKCLEFIPYENNQEELIVPTPYTELYRYWLESKVHFASREIAAANNAVTQFNTYYDNYASYYGRNHQYKRDLTWIM